MVLFIKRNVGYSLSLLVLTIFSLVLAPITAYAQDNSLMQNSFVIQPITGGAIPSDTLPVSLVYNLNTYLVDSFTQGTMDAQTFNDFVNSGVISENGFFENSVFVGDSLTVGFEQYCKTHNDSIATGSTHFLARVGCSAQAAISSNALTKHSKIMPKYNGSVQYIEDAITQMPDVKKAFICYGMNDLVGSSPAKFVENLQTLVNKILIKNPGLQIYIISIPCIVSTANTGSLNNASIQNANLMLQNACIINNWGFINLSEYLMGNNHAIRQEYSSDGYVHENNKAYSIWNRVLKNYAYQEITSSRPVVNEMMFTEPMVAEPMVAEPMIDTLVQNDIEVTVE